MSTGDQIFHCKREGCKPEESGVCIDGLPLSDCPNRFMFEPVDEDLIVEAASTNSEEPLGRILHNGESFSVLEADEYLRRYGATVVAFIGCPNAGKTTAAVMLYELSKRRKLGAFGFVGSRTIRGFQRRAHKSLLASGRSVADTEHTSVGSPVSFLHLRLQSAGENDGFMDLLLSDRSGEDFVQCLDKPYLCSEFPEIMRADCHVILVDGAKLMNPGEAPRQIADVRRLFISLNQCGAIANSGLVQVVLTKHDLISCSKHKDATLQRFDDFVKNLRGRISGNVMLTAHKLAARPSCCTNFELGDGLGKLVSDWLPKKLKTEYHLSIPTLSNGTAFDLLIIGPVIKQLNQAA